MAIIQMSKVNDTVQHFKQLNLGEMWEALSIMLMVVKHEEERFKIKLIKQSEGKE